MGAKTGTGTYVLKLIHNIIYLRAKDVWINWLYPQDTMSVWMGFSKVKQYGENSFVGHSQQKYRSSDMKM